MSKKTGFFWHFFFNFDGFWSLCLLEAILAQKDNSFICRKKMWCFDTPGTPGGASIVERIFLGSKQPVWYGKWQAPFLGDNIRNCWQIKIFDGTFRNNSLLFFLGILGIHRKRPNHVYGINLKTSPSNQAMDLLENLFFVFYIQNHSRRKLNGFKYCHTSKLILAPKCRPFLTTRPFFGFKRRSGSRTS